MKGREGARPGCEWGKDKETLEKGVDEDEQRRINGEW